jgi:hypothetical protein
MIVLLSGFLFVLRATDGAGVAGADAFVRRQRRLRSPAETFASVGSDLRPGSGNSMPTFCR